MESVNMSQSAEQAALGNVRPDGNSGVKRQVSADAFRALTMRLNGTAAPVVNPVADPVIAPVQLPELAIEPIATATVEVQIKPVIDVPPVVAVLPEPLVEVEIPSLPIMPAELTSVEVTAEPVAVEVAPEPIALEPVAVETTTVESTTVEPVADDPVVEPSPFAMPTGGTKIILNASVTAAFKSKVEEKPHSGKSEKSESDSKPVELIEAIQPDNFLDAQPDNHSVKPSTELQPNPVDQPLDPLLAAMNLVQTSEFTVEATDVALVQTPKIEEIDIAPEPAVPAEPPFEIESENQAEPAASTVLETEPVGETEPVVAPTILEVEPETVEKPEPTQPEPTQPEPILDEQPVTATITATVPEVVEAPQTSQGPLVVDVSTPAVEFEPDAQSGETARALLDMMSGGSQPQERALAADTLLQLVPRMMVKDLVALSERVCMMENPPSLLVSALINHRDSRVAAPLLEDGYAIGEQELMRLIAGTKKEQLIMIAKRRKVGSSVCDALISRGEPSVYLTLVRNPGAALSHDAFVAICEIAKTQFSLQAPLATRGDTPPPIAFELFWSLPVELRRYILSRFLTDSGTLDKILKLTQSVDNGKSSDHKFPPHRKIEELVELIAGGVTDEAAEMLAKLAGCNQENARRIIADPDGEPLAVVFKAMGLSRSGLSQAIKKCANSSKAMLRGDRNLNELQIMFDSLSFNKARTLLTYWDWAVEKTGPYARRVM